jgi:peptide chain release factor 1
VQRRATRRSLVKTADRSEKIRTYNFAQVCEYHNLVPSLNVRLQDRVTDHRIGLTVKNLEGVMEGDGLRSFIDALKKDYEESLVEDMLE